MQRISPSAAFNGSFNNRVNFDAHNLIKVELLVLFLCSFRSCVIQYYTPLI